MALYDVFDEEGRSLSLTDLPSSLAARGEVPEPLLVRNVIRATGEERWLLHKATPVFDADGSLSLIVSVIEDLTDVKRAELAQRLLAEAGQELSSSLDYAQTLQQVARAGGVRARRPVRGRDAGRRRGARGGRGGRRGAGDGSPRRRVGRGARGGARGCRRGGRIRPARLAGGDRRSSRDRRPAADRRAVAGDGESGRTFAESDLASPRELGPRAAIAVENARLYAERSQIATTLQRSLLPPDLPEIPGFRLASLYRAAGEQNEVGGDFYDAFEVPGAGWWSSATWPVAAPRRPR